MAVTDKLLREEVSVAGAILFALGGNVQPRPNPRARPVINAARFCNFLSLICSTPFGDASM
ncbi:MAG: hypothetical protein O7C67_16015 [Gammaproteobacteria bacterium]|nr:hypothetical protein [Gammaproteobacteria bacterium]